MSLRRDLNGDGVRDTIRITRLKAEKYRQGHPNNGRYRLTVNGRTLIGKYPAGWMELEGFFLDDLDRRDRFKEIVVTLRGTSSDHGAAAVYWYSGSVLRPVHAGTLAWNEFPGDGTARAVVAWHGFWGPADRYRLRARDHQLVRVPQKWYPLNVSTLLTKALPLRKAAGSGEIIAVVPRGRKMIFLKGDRDGKWYRVRSAGGSQGWIEFQPAHEGGCFGHLVMAG